MIKKNNQDFELNPNLVITAKGHDGGVGDQYRKTIIKLNETEFIRSQRVTGGSP